MKGGGGQNDPLIPLRVKCSIDIEDDSLSSMSLILLSCFVIFSSYVFTSSM